MANKPLCEEARALPASPLMKSKGNDYFTCSGCGEPCDEPTANNTEDVELREKIRNIQGYKTNEDGTVSADYDLTRSNREQTEAYLELIQQESNRQSEQEYKRGFEDGRKAPM